MKVIHPVLFINIDTMMRRMIEICEGDELPDFRATTLNIASHVQDEIRKMNLGHSDCNIEPIVLPGPRSEMGVLESQIDQAHSIGEEVLKGVFVEFEKTIIDVLMSDFSYLFVMNDYSFSEREMNWLKFNQYLNQHGVFSCEATSDNTLTSIIDGLITDSTQSRSFEMNGKMNRYE